MFLALISNLKVIIMGDAVCVQSSLHMLRTGRLNVLSESTYSRDQTI